MGQNNAGKSTLVEALRLISIVTERYKNLIYHDVPDWLNIRGNHRGVRPSLEGLEILFDTIFYRYGEPPSLIKCFFNTGEKIIFYIGPNNQIHCVIFDRNGQVVKSKTEAKRVSLPIVKILPQIGPLSMKETRLTSDYVRHSMPTYLSSIHFRNQLCLLKDLYDEFKNLSESHWRGLQIRSFDGRGTLPGDPLNLLVRDMDFVAEVGLMGHGLQMWLQIMWFLIYCKNATTIILDEPDVYMHADLQRKLIRLLMGRHPQTIITTHSVEIMAEVESENILIVDKNKTQSVFANSLGIVQKLIDNIGGVHNIQWARIWNTKKILLVEGNDFKILKQFHNILFPENEIPFDVLPNLPLGGWGGWNYAIGTNILIKSEGGEEIKCYCLFDSDYHTDEEIQKRYQEAKERDVNLYIWNYKEIENYLINSEVIFRYLDEKYENNNIPSIKIIDEKIEKITESMKEEVIIAFGYEIFTNQRPGYQSANRKARKYVETIWNLDKGYLKLVSGKQLIKEISKWLSDEYSVSINAIELAKSFLPNEINSEISQVLESIEKNQSFSSNNSRVLSITPTGDL